MQHKSYLQGKCDERTAAILRREDNVKRLLELRAIHAAAIDKQVENLLAILNLVCSEVSAEPPYMSGLNGGGSEGGLRIRHACTYGELQPLILEVKVDQFLKNTIALSGTYARRTLVHFALSNARITACLSPLPVERKSALPSILRNANATLLR